jgi:hypothetical protein
MVNTKGYERNRPCPNCSARPVLSTGIEGDIRTLGQNRHCVPPEIQEEDLSRMLEELYRCANLFGWTEDVKLTSLITHDCSLNLTDSFYYLISGTQTSEIQNTLDV